MLWYSADVSVSLVLSSISQWHGILRGEQPLESLSSEAYASEDMHAVRGVFVICLGLPERRWNSVGIASPVFFSDTASSA
jgi:hypothetical protein